MGLKLFGLKQGGVAIGAGCQSVVAFVNDKCYYLVGTIPLELYLDLLPVWRSRSEFRIHMGGVSQNHFCSSLQRIGIEMTCGVTS